MRLFSYLYRLMMRWSQHPHAVYYLGSVSFIEASIFPLPPDLMLAPMSLATPTRAWWYATIATLMSVLGALLGYIIGMFFFYWIAPWLEYFGYMPAYQQVQTWFNEWGAWVLFIAALSPIPFKLFTIAGGALHISLTTFMIGSFIGRSIRFYLVASLMRFGGEKMHLWLERVIDRIGWSVVGLLLISYSIYWYCTT